MKAHKKPPRATFGSLHVRKRAAVSRPTETAASLRVVYGYLLRRYLAGGNIKDLERYIECVGAGALDSDFAVTTVGKRPTERRGCVSCGGRYEEKSFWHGVKQSNGTVQLVKSWYCEVCRERQRGRKWYDVMADDASGQPQGVRFRVVKGRDNVRGARVRGA